MENPENEARWRQLPGHTPDKDELRTKLSHLQERLNDKNEQLLERELILEEVRRLHALCTHVDRGVHGGKYGFRCLCFS